MKLQTDYPVATTSPDHIHPQGTRVDNHTSLELLGELKEYGATSLLDLGCAGGQLIIDAWSQGFRAAGLEGSDYGVSFGRQNWHDYHNSLLFTCDISYPYQMVNNGDKPVLFDVISAWEVNEHIATERLKVHLENVRKHLAPKGIFIGTTSTVAGEPWHQSVFDEEKWTELFEKAGLSLEQYPFTGSPRLEGKPLGRPDLNEKEPLHSSFLYLSKAL